MNLLTVRGLSVDYATPNGPARAVHGIDFHVNQGEVIGLAGESGSGKSTVAKAIMRILQPPGFISGGSVLLNGRDVLTMSRSDLRDMRWTEMAMVFQSALDSLNPVLPIEAQFQDLAIARLGRRLAPAQLREFLRFVDLENRVLSSYPHQLSGGMRQRVGIALALVLKPKLLILDEPTTALDVVVQRHILRGLQRLQKELNFSILFITHDLPVLLAMSDRIIIMKDGLVCEADTPSALRRRPEHPYTQQLLASMQLLEDGGDGSPEERT
ncbi:MAG: sugar ABC transporter ATP-binding protein [Myxococcales bacterium]|nr:sugar ABC transporter ATP-binding protein [Myxococcales bacterium]